MAIVKFSEYIQAIEKFRKKATGEELWYRGHSAATYKLEPGIHRKRKAGDKAAIEKMERAVFEEFSRRSPLYDGHRRDDWDLLFLMQHYRAPTRLLDWTASPLVALFFALMSADGSEDAVIWCLDPAEWNGVVLRDISEPPRIFTTEEGLIKQYHPIYNDKSSRNEPLAIQGIMNNPRINAQKGRFVIFSAGPRSLEDYASEYKVSGTGKVLTSIAIARDKTEDILRDLESYGITYSTIFPDLEGLAIEIRRRHGGKYV